jgi:hypothetical protein
LAKGPWGRRFNRAGAGGRSIGFICEFTETRSSISPAKSFNKKNAPLDAAVFCLYGLHSHAIINTGFCA